jgi:hypothetical protein
VTVQAQSAPAVSPWLQMAHDHAADWFRGHPGAPLTEYGAWCEGYEYGQVLAAGYGWQPGGAVTRQMQDALDAAYVGLQAARDVEDARRGGRRAAGGVAGRVGRLEWLDGAA